MLVVLGVLAQLLVSATDLDGVWRALATKAVPLAAILLPAGFFLSVLGRDVHRPNRLIVLVWLGAASLAVGLVALGVGLLTA
ncbi:hypothetical protein GCM10025868_40410 [Angustibacter aerolatus]|uniref:Uncharacterized protein n=1 Tax=Angustibacter aerolatus TaxID=1162965 RepID=A0ABQ6JQ39_9ACTN|nr:hypothetical protein [Angustibacter aerolatus]GMA88791.1 hypothetical protein GCM10025868_40410 [Angustibacter aerolatus]